MVLKAGIPSTKSVSACWTVSSDLTIGYRRRSLSLRDGVPISITSPHLWHSAKFNSRGIYRLFESHLVPAENYGPAMADLIGLF